MLTQVRIVIASHLSDIQETANHNAMLSNDIVIQRLNFCKYLLSKYSDTTQVIDADKVYSEFENYTANNK
jgi:hypothetical protein